MFRNGIGAPEILIILGVVVLLFGGRKLPELARGSGRALRIFKSEIKEASDDDKPTAEQPREHRVVDPDPVDDAPRRTEQG